MGSTIGGFASQVQGHFIDINFIELTDCFLERLSTFVPARR
jgi:hypothetical protein